MVQKKALKHQPSGGHPRLLPAAVAARKQTRTKKEDADAAEEDHEMEEDANSVASAAAASTSTTAKTKDKTKGKKNMLTAGEEMNEQQYRELTKLVAQLGLALSTQMRVVKSIGVETLLLKREVKAGGEDKSLLEMVKATTKKHYEDSKNTSEAQRAELGPAHTHVAWCLLQWLERYGKDHDKLQEEEGKKAYEEVKEYVNKTKGMAAELMAVELNQKIRYIRLEKAYKADMKLEVGVGALSQKGAMVWEAVRVLLIKLANASPKMGMAPKGNLERRVLAQLQAMGLGNEATMAEKTWV
eukprot:TRINITY_DN36101_c0_g1_i1.p2 TRINITY_DN36101_c0_g1~~TRINITY_DN36101_c0_g1_i1.p2  ORF type:complete len:299 (-),score=96.52 TRINITY_DN36101_c0_g1_i1:443-1339(-)